MNISVMGKKIQCEYIRDARKEKKNIELSIGHIRMMWGKYQT